MSEKLKAVHVKNGKELISTVSLQQDDDLLNENSRRKRTMKTAQNEARNAVKNQENEESSQANGYNRQNGNNMTRKKLPRVFSKSLANKFEGPPEPRVPHNNNNGYGHDNNLIKGIRRLPYADRLQIDKMNGLGYSRRSNQFVKDNNRQQFQRGSSSQSQQQEPGSGSGPRQSQPPPFLQRTTRRRPPPSIEAAQQNRRPRQLPQRRGRTPPPPARAQQNQPIRILQRRTQPAGALPKNEESSSSIKNALPESRGPQQNHPATNFRRPPPRRPPFHARQASNNPTASSRSESSSNGVSKPSAGLQVRGRAELEQGGKGRPKAEDGSDQNEKRPIAIFEMVGVITHGPMDEDDSMQFLTYQFKSKRFSLFVPIRTQNLPPTCTVGTWLRLIFPYGISLEEHRKAASGCKPLNPKRAIPCQRRVITRCFDGHVNFLVLASRKGKARNGEEDGERVAYKSRLGTILLYREDLKESECFQEDGEEEGGRGEIVEIPEKIRLWCYPCIPLPDEHEGNSSGQNHEEEEEGDYDVAEPEFKLKRIEERFFMASNGEGEGQEEEEDGDEAEQENLAETENCEEEEGEKLSGSCVEGEKPAAEKRMNSAQAQMSPPKLPPSFSTWLSALVGDYFETSRMSAERKRRIYDFVDELQEMLRFQLGLPRVELKLFGSVNSGFGSQNSDLDICLVNTGLDTRNSQRCVAQRRRILMRVAERLRADNDFGPITSVLDARTPIIKFEHGPTGFHGDISLENTLAIHNTELLQLYTHFDERLALLGFAVKQWAKLCGLNDASVGSISSYAYIVMLIHFLQRCQPPVLPFLQECEDGPSTIDTEVEGWQVRFSRELPSSNEFGNSQSVEELFRGFLHYFGCQFCPLTDVAQIRTSAEYRKRQRRMPEGWKLCVEDPFDLDHNLTSGVHEETLEHLFNSMRATKRGLEQFCRKYFARDEQPKTAVEEKDDDVQEKQASPLKEEAEDQKKPESGTSSAPPLPLGMDFSKLMSLFKQRRIIRTVPKKKKVPVPPPPSNGKKMPADEQKEEKNETDAKGGKAEEPEEEGKEEVEETRQDEGKAAAEGEEGAGTDEEEAAVNGREEAEDSSPEEVQQ